MLNNTDKIRQLNDILRTTFTGGRVLTTIGIRSKSVEDVSRILAKVRSFNKFNKSNNVYGERDYGSFDHNGEKIIWKIDYYDQDYRYMSENPADPTITNRVLTIMTADEY